MSAYTATRDDHYHNVDLNKVMAEIERVMHVDRKTILTNIEYFFLTWNKMMINKKHMARGNPSITCEVSDFNSFILCTLYMMVSFLTKSKGFMSRVQLIFGMTAGNGSETQGLANFRVRCQTPAKNQSCMLTQNKGRELVLLDAIMLAQHIIYIFDFMDLIRFWNFILYNPTYDVKTRPVASRCAIFLEEIVIQICMHDHNHVMYAPLYNPDFVRKHIPMQVFGFDVPRPIGTTSDKRKILDVRR